MPKKKNPPTGFSVYMKEMQKELAKRGRYLRMEQMPSEAIDKWKALSPEEKTRYNNKAKEEKHKMKNNQSFKSDSFGTSVAAPKRIVSEAEQKRATMIEKVNTILSRLMSNADLIKEKFYIINFNIACRTYDNIFIPAEIGLVEFSIEKGITNEYHCFIDPGTLPPGCKASCIEETKDVHGIPHEDFCLANKDYGETYDALIDFTLNPERNWVDTYSLPEDLEKNEKCLDWLYQKAKQFDKEMPFQVIDITLLFEGLRERGKKPVDPAFALAALTKPTFDYVPEIGCEYHDSIDKAKNCALGKVKRQAYLLADSLIEFFEVECIDGQHLPEVEDIDNSISIRPSDYTFGRIEEERSLGDIDKKPSEPPMLSMIKKVGKSSVFQRDLDEISEFSTASGNPSTSTGPPMKRQKTDTRK